MDTVPCRTVPMIRKPMRPPGITICNVAEWEQEGVEYQLVADQMELEDVVKVVASMIYGQEEILIVQG